MLEKLKKMLAAKEARKAELAEKSKTSEDVAELRAIAEQVEALNDEIVNVHSMIEQEEGRDKKDEEFRSEKGIEQIGEGELRALGTYIIKDERAEEKRAKLEEAEKRGQALKEKRAVTVAASDILVPAYFADDIRPTFGEVSSLIDRVSHKFLKGGESFKQPYLKGYGIGDYTDEKGKYHGATGSKTANAADPVFDYATIAKTKVTAYVEDTEELQKLPAADYDAEVVKGVRVASRKKITRDILVGDGTGELMGIYETDVIDNTTDISVNKIINTTLDEIIFSYGGDEEVEDAAVLILNKIDLKAFAQLRSWDGKKIHTIVTNGNTGTIDGIPFVINSITPAITTSQTNGQYCMAYGPLSNYQLVTFSDFDVRRSDDFKFDEGVIAHRSSVFMGGNVVSHNGFLRVKKSTTPVPVPPDTALSNLTISNVAFDFDTDETFYAGTIDLTHPTSQITPVVVDEDAAVFVYANGSRITPNSSGQYIVNWAAAFDEKDAVVINVVVELGGENTSYIVVVTDGTAVLPPDTTLATLAISDVTLAPQFSKNTVFYNGAWVSNEADGEVTLTATEAEAEVTVYIDGILLEPNAITSKLEFTWATVFGGEDTVVIQAVVTLDGATSVYTVAVAAST